jgi:hypothetical protein
MERICVGDKTENTTDENITYLTNSRENGLVFIIFNTFSVSNSSGGISTSSSSGGGGGGGKREYP